MKEQWKLWAAKYEAFSMRERVMLALAAAACIVFLMYLAVLDPASARERALKTTIQAQRQQIAAIDMELAQKDALARVDPDQATRDRLAGLRTENTRMRDSLRAMQKGLVPPEKIGQVLQQVLQGGKLRLVSLKTLPPRGMSDGRFAEPDSAAAPAPYAAAAPATVAAAAGGAAAAEPGAALGQAQAAPKPVKREELLYRHGVEVVLQGSYLDMVSYMEALESMPSQLFWGKASLKAEEYPKATLSLTLYTLSLDTKWIAL